MGDICIRLPLRSQSIGELTSKIIELQENGYSNAVEPLQQELKRRFIEDGVEP